MTEITGYIKAEVQEVEADCGHVTDILFISPISLQFKGKGHRTICQRCADVEARMLMDMSREADYDRRHLR